MPSPAEIVANILVAACIVLAARNNIHTWWTGILGCGVFAWVFFDARLYGDFVLQLFFVAANVGGWRNWLHGNRGSELPVRWTPPASLVTYLLGASAFAAVWSYAMATFTDAASPIADAIILALSVAAQFLMMGRRVENWIVWIVVNTIAVPLFWSRGLHLTSSLYAFYWLNAWYAFFHWRKLARDSQVQAAA